MPCSLKLSEKVTYKFCLPSGYEWLHRLPSFSISPGELVVNEWLQSGVSWVYNNRNKCADLLFHRTDVTCYDSVLQRMRAELVRFIRTIRVHRNRIISIQCIR